MYAIVRDRGKQYKVSLGESILIDVRENLKESDPIEFNEVLVVGGEDKCQVGSPLLKGAKVVGQVEGEKIGEKIKIYKFKRRKNYRRQLGHRQHFIQVKIKEIVL